MADYDFGDLATPVKKPAQSYDFGGLASPATPKEVQKSSFLSKAANVLGPLEALGNLATGAIAKPISDVAGLAAVGKEMISPTPGGGDPQGFKNYVQNALTYEPRTAVGKGAAENSPFARIGQGIGKVADVAGGAIAGDRSNMLRSMAGDATREAITQAPGFIPGLKGTAATRLAGEEASLARQKVQNAPADAALAKARDQGYVFPPSVSRNTGPLSSFFQGEVGSTKLDYGSSYKNQRVTNAQIKTELGLPADEAISQSSLNDIRDKAGQAYEAVKTAVPKLQTTKAFKDALSNPNSKFDKARSEFPDYFKDAEIEKLTKTLSKPEFSSDAAIQMQKKLRYDGNANLKAFDKPNQQALGEAQLNAAKAIDDLIDENLALKAPPGVNNFQSKLSTNLANARKTIAQSYAVEGALNDKTGNVSARSLAKLWQKQGTLTGGLKNVAESYTAFPKQLRDVDTLPATASEKISNLDVGKAAMLAGMGHGALGLASTVARSLIKPILLSDWYQSANIKAPTYKPGASYTVPAGIGTDPYLYLGIPKPPPDNK